MKGTGQEGWGARILLGAALAALAAAGLLFATTRIEVEGRWRGLFLLEARDGRMLELKDDLYLGDGSRLVVGLSFSTLRRWLGAGLSPPAPGEASLALDWDERTGRGVVRNRLGDGSELVTLFGRYEDSDGGHPRGLFVGGAVPDVAGDLAHQDQSGMALQEGGHWTHIWCSVNEAAVDMVEPQPVMIYPGSFQYLGSRVLLQDARRVVLESNHEIRLRRGSLRMDRYAYFTAGEPFFRLGIRLTALGPETVNYSYVYGDEPWVGRFGSAAGNFGWVQDGYRTFEGRVDPTANRWAGIVDMKTTRANFVEWMGDDLPDDVYFSNKAGTFADAAQRVPLNSNEIFIGLQWVGRRLAPGEGRSMLLVLGVADRDPATGAPRLPPAALQR
jgi:hypothetical protein